MNTLLPVEDWIARARTWLEQQWPASLDWRTDAEVRRETDSDSVAVFQSRTESEERIRLEAAAQWQQRKCDAGYGAIAVPAEHGGQGLSDEHARAFADLERLYETPANPTLARVTLGLIGPTLEAIGTESQKQRFVRSFARLDEFACQLFSEPGAGSDLANLSCRADRHGDHWILNGQKVWTSEALFAGWGELIARSDPSVPKHEGMTAFMIPLSAPGVDIRPIRQMTGGSSFNEVFLTDVRIGDDLRLGAVGDGWRVALTTLGFERRSASASDKRVGGSMERVLDVARHNGKASDPVIRQQLAHLYTRTKLLEWNNTRSEVAARAGNVPGPESSIAKLFWSQNLTAVSECISSILGPSLLADTGEWGTYAWTEHLLGSPGYRIAAGSDEIQRNLIAERVLRMPPEPRIDRDKPFRSRTTSKE
jgi:alkylation response protein AidB-like acyl-CoA dehydrogenase